LYFPIVAAAAIAANNGRFFGSFVAGGRAADNARFWRDVDGQN